MMNDTYRNFKELIVDKKEGVDFQIKVIDRATDWVVIAIHGGNIEPGTTEIANSIAGQDLSFYSFVGIKDEGRSRDLHITSSRFDEPLCRDLIDRSKKAISIHGKSDIDPYIMIGGLDTQLIQRLDNEYQASGFKTLVASEEINGNSFDNICNRCASKRGLQLEISRGLRDSLIKDKVLLDKFSHITRNVMNSL